MACCVRTRRVREVSLDSAVESLSVMAQRSSTANARALEKEGIRVGMLA